MARDQPPTEPRDGPAREGVAGAGDTDSNTLQLFAEEAHVARRTVETGRVRVATITHTRDHLIDELLARTNVEVERVPVGRTIEAIPPVGGDADHTIIPIVEETVVVERKLVLKEELHIRCKHTTERYQETVKLRHQTAEVTRIPAEEPVTGSESAIGAKTGRNREDT
jgi:uncharacterized protein (TIGR02271 family)